MEQGAPGVLSPQPRVPITRAGLRGSLYRTFLLLFLTLVFVPMVAIFVFVGYRSQAQATEQVQGQLSSVVSLQRAQIDQWISERERTMQLLVGQPGLLDSARIVLTTSPTSTQFLEARLDLRSRLNAARESDAEYYAFLLASTSNSRVVFATSAEYDVLLLSFKEFFQEARTAGHVQLPGVDVSVNRDDPLLHGGRPFMAASTPVRDEQGNVVGVLAGLIEAGNLGTILQNIEGLTEGQAYLFDTQGRLLASSTDLSVEVPEDPQIKFVARPDTHTGEHPVLAGTRYTNFAAQDVLGYGQWYTYYNVNAGDAARRRTSPTGLVLFVEQPYSVALGGVQQLQIALVGASVLGLIFVALGGFFAARSLVRPVRALTDSAVSIAGGNLDQTVRINRSDELGLLANAFNQMTSELKSLYTGLEEKVAARTQDLEQANSQVIRRALQLQTSAEVAQAATSILDPTRLLDRVVNLIRERFGFYHVQVFLMSADGRWAELRASTGKVGRQMLARKHRLETGSHSLIGYVTANRKAHVAMDVGSDEFHRFNPLLPETRAELAIPLMIGEQLLGVLDVQSTDLNAFSAEDIALFESLAAQVTVAIENARLYQSAQEMVRRERVLKTLSNQIRGSLDVDHILETTARELSNALGASRAVVRMGAVSTPVATTVAAVETGNGHEGDARGEADGDGAAEPAP